jgi:hypothetical protein
MAIDLRSPEFEACIVSVWKQALVESAKRVVVDGDSYSVRRTAKSKLAQVDFEFQGEPFRGLEQNPKTQSKLGTVSSQRRKSNAVPARRPLRRSRPRRKNLHLRQTEQLSLYYGDPRIWRFIDRGGCRPGFFLPAAHGSRWS